MFQVNFDRRLVVAPEVPGYVSIDYYRGGDARIRTISIVNDRKRREGFQVVLLVGMKERYEFLLAILHDQHSPFPDTANHVRWLIEAINSEMIWCLFIGCKKCNSFLVCVPRGHGSHDTILFDIKSYPKVLFNALFVLWQLLTQESPELLNDRQQLLVGIQAGSSRANSIYPPVLLSSLDLHPNALLLVMNKVG